MMRSGVAGVGHLGRYHAQKYASSPLSKLVGVYDLDQERAGQVAEEIGTEVFPDLAALLQKVDVLTIAAPTSAHFALAQEALAAGVHCLIEKPFTATLTEADALIDQAEEKGLVLAVGHLKRLHPAVLALKEFGLGSPSYVEAQRLAPFKPRSLDIDVLMDLMIHDLDLTLDFTGAQVTEVRATGVAVATNKTDMANAWIDFDNGAAACLSASRMAREPVRRMRLFWNHAYASIDFSANQMTLYRPDPSVTEGPIPGASATTLNFDKRDVLADEVNDFLETVMTKKSQVFCSGAHGRRALDAVLQVKSAIEARKAVARPTDMPLPSELAAVLERYKLQTPEA